MIEKNYQDAEVKMRRCIESLGNELAKLRTGRAHPSLLEHIRVHCYGNDSPLNQMASVSASDARTLTILAWDKNNIAAIEKAIHAAGLGLNPMTSGTTIRVPLPALTEERRRDLIKIVKQEAETARVGIRNVRRDANQHVKDLLKGKKITEDDSHRSEERMQKLTDKMIADIDKLVHHKEAELLEV